MTFKEEIDFQVKNCESLTQEMLNGLKEPRIEYRFLTPHSKHHLFLFCGSYSSGRKMQVGDKYLVGFMLVEWRPNNEETIRYISFHEEEIGTLYEEDSSFYVGSKAHNLPMIKKIEDGKS
jgi:hypothetical protein